jgi:hypothetical protein
MSAPRGRRGRRTVRVVLGLLVAGTLLGPARAGDAETAPADLGGFQGTAAASGLHALYNPSGLLPIPPPVDIGAPDALATIASGPQTFARASVLDPGDLLANPDAFLALASAGYPAGTLPAYPFRVSASSGVGAPSAESNPGPGLNSRVSVDNGGSTAQATMPAVDAPAVATVGSMTAKTTTRTDGPTVTVTARSQVSGINVLGLVTIDSVVTDLTATSDGNTTKFTGGTKVVGASVLGQPVSIDADGVHQAPGSAPALQGVISSLTGSLNDILRNVGMRITVAGPVEVSGGAAGQRATDGLRIDLEFSPTTFPQLAALIKALPPIDNPLPGTPSIEDVLAATQARHLASIELGRGLVALEARPAVAFTPPTSPTTPSGGAELPAYTPVSPGFGLPSMPVTGTPLAPGPPVRTSDTSDVPTGVGVGSLVLLALLASPFIGELLARFGTAVLAADRSESCSWEEP